MAEKSNYAKRNFRAKQITRGYQIPTIAKVDPVLYSQLSESGWKNIEKQLQIPRRSALAWEVRAGQTCRIVLPGSQVGDMNLWNLHNKKEHFYSGKTRQIHQSHLTTLDRLWSNLPYLRPLATITADSLEGYGIDQDGFGVHDVLGTRCDPYIHKLISGEECESSCHQSLTKAIKPWGLNEFDVHDVFNIFMCTAFDRNTGEYMIRGSPAERGDFIEILAEEDLLVAVSACPYGDVSVQCGNSTLSEVVCHHMDVYIGQPEETLIDKWKLSKVDQM